MGKNGAVLAKIRAALENGKRKNLANLRNRGTPNVDKLLKFFEGRRKDILAHKEALQTNQLEAQVTSQAIATQVTEDAKGTSLAEAPSVVCDDPRNSQRVGTLGDYQYV